MAYTACCSELKKLVAKPRSEKGLGLVIVTAKWGTQFIVEYRKDWNVPIAEDSVQIAFCPFCGSRLNR